MKTETKRRDVGQVARFDFGLLPENPTQDHVRGILHEAHEFYEMQLQAIQSDLANERALVDKALQYMVDFPGSIVTREYLDDREHLDELIAGREEEDNED